MIKSGILEGAEEIIHKEKTQKRKELITADLLNIMDRRRKIKNLGKEEDQQTYKNLRNEFNREVRQAKSTLKMSVLKLRIT